MCRQVDFHVYKNILYTNIIYHNLYYSSFISTNIYIYIYIFSMHRISCVDRRTAGRSFKCFVDEAGAPIQLLKYTAVKARTKAVKALTN